MLTRDDFYNAREASEILGIRLEYVYPLAKRQKWEEYRDAISNEKLFLKSDVDGLKKNRYVRANSGSSAA